MKKRGIIKRSFSLLLCLAAFSLAAALPVGAAIYEGSISTKDETLYATSPWSGGSSLEWTVTNDGPYSPYWTYTYTFTVPYESRDISHLILETSTTFLHNNILSPLGENVYLGWHNENGNSNPGISDPIYGLKWDELSGYSYTFSITSNRVPMWGDFYAKDGVSDEGEVYAYNTGFGVKGYQDYAWDSEEAINAGKVLLPNSHVVPIPGSLLLLGSGLIGWLGWRRRKGIKTKS